MWIKICGIRDVATAQAVAGLGPSAIGLNFYERTPRVVPTDVAEKIVSGLPAQIEPIGLFVNHPADQILAMCRRCRLRTIQLHGDEPPELLVELQERDHDLKIIRAYRLGPDGLGPLADYLDACRRRGARLAACLIDARVEGMYGGSGKTVPWHLLDEQSLRHDWPPIILAGGLHPGNVAEAIRAVRPWGVDVSSGVESSLAKKDLGLVERFIEAAREVRVTGDWSVVGGQPRSSE